MRRGSFGWAAGVLGLAATANAQTFLNYSVYGENVTRAPGIIGDELIAVAGDTIRVYVTVDHDGFSYAGGQFDIIGTGLSIDEVTIGENDDPWTLGRTEHTRNALSDGPAEPRNNAIAVANDDVHGGDIVISDETFGGGSTGWFDMGTIPPGFGGAVGDEPIASGDTIFIFEYEFTEDFDRWYALPSDVGRVWDGPSDQQGVNVDLGTGGMLNVIPPPASVALLGLGGLAAARRRRA